LLILRREREVPRVLLFVPLSFDVVLDDVMDPVVLPLVLPVLSDEFDDVRDVDPVDEPLLLLLLFALVVPEVFWPVFHVPLFVLFADVFDVCPLVEDVIEQIEAVLSVTPLVPVPLVPLTLVVF